MYRSNAEYFDIVPNLRKHPPVEITKQFGTVTSRYHGMLSRNEYLCIMEVIKGLKPMQGPKGLITVDKEAHDDILYKLGKLTALDSLINNYDRIPLRCMWDNDGNLENVLIEDGTNDIVGIDQAVCPITNPQGYERFSRKLAALCHDLVIIGQVGSVDGARRSESNIIFKDESYVEELVMSIYVCTGVAFTKEQVKEHFSRRGLVDGFTDIARNIDVEKVNSIERRCVETYSSGMVEMGQSFVGNCTKFINANIEVIKKYFH